MAEAFRDLPPAQQAAEIESMRGRRTPTPADDERLGLRCQRTRRERERSLSGRLVEGEPRIDAVLLTTAHRVLVPVAHNQLQVGQARSPASNSAQIASTCSS
jgi:hypothetical protein